MTSTQFLVIVGIIYIAPHLTKTAGHLMGLGFIVCAAVIGLSK